MRYYDRVKLLPRANRSAGGFRLFGLDAIERVQFIKQAQELGLTLDEIKGLLATGGAEECRRVRDTSIPEKVLKLIREGLCACEARNPSGMCCLAAVNRTAVHLKASMKHELEAKRAQKV